MKKIGFVCFALVFLLYSCASYQAIDLSALDPQFIKQYPELGEVSIGCKEFSIKDCETYLDRDLISKGVQPIQLTFHNNSEKTYLFSSKNISLPTVETDHVATKVCTSTIVRVVGYTVGALFATPMIIPAVVDGIKSYNANKRLYSDFRAKAKETMVIAPKSFGKTLLFIPKEAFSPIFSISLVDQETGEEKQVEIIACGN